MEKQSPYQVSRGTSTPDSGDFVRAVSELPGCLQPVFSGSFRSSIHKTSTRIIVPHTLHGMLHAPVMQVLQYSPVRVLSSGLWLRYQHGKQRFGLALHCKALVKVTALCANHSVDMQVVAAPTGSGKTGVMELAILRLVSGYIDQDHQFVLKPGSLKVVYLAPIRALVQEKVKQWQQSFGGKLGLTCYELTGDTDAADGLHLDNADIICTTPEKFGRSTRQLPPIAPEELIGDLRETGIHLEEVGVLRDLIGCVWPCRCCHTAAQRSRWDEVLWRGGSCLSCF